MRNENLKERTQRFAIEIVRLVEKIPGNQIANVLGNQLLKAGTSVGANYRAACRAKSKADFIFKMSIVEEETDEVLYWLELLLEAKLLNRTQIQHLMAEANEIIAMVVSSIKTARNNK